MQRTLIALVLVIAMPMTVIAQETVLDTDGDGLLNSEEDKNGDGIVNTGETDPFNADTDGGGEADGSEIQHNRNPFDRSDDMTYDLDNDGLTNIQEDAIGTDRANPDTDNDNLNDKDDPFPLEGRFRKDTDGDGLPDSFEIEHGLQPDVRSDGIQDIDGDGLTNIDEFIEGTDLTDKDTDKDGTEDGKEVEQGTDPLENPCLFLASPSEVLHDLEGHWSKPYVTALQRTKINEDGPRIITGYVTDKGGEFRPNQHISRYELLKIALLGSCITPDPSVDDGSFTFQDFSWRPRPFENEDETLKRRVIYTAFNKKVVKGYSDGNFKPDAPVNRAEAVKMLFLASGLEPFDNKDYSGRFTDLEEGAWYNKYIEHALSYEFIEGYEDGTFRPGQNITRAEASKIMLFMMIANPKVNGYVVPVEDLDL